MKTALGSSSAKGGNTPKLTVKSCDGRVLFSDDNVQTKAAGESKMWEVSNFDKEKHTIQLEATGSDNWLVNMDMDLCDDNGENCEEHLVTETYAETYDDTGNPFWIDDSCAPYGHTDDGCSQIHKCNCYSGKFYITYGGDSFWLDRNENTCDLIAADPKMTVSCNDNSDDTVKMTATVRKTEVHGKPSADFADNGAGFWQATYTANQLEKNFENNLIFDGFAAADYLVLSKTVNLPCKNLRVDGVDVCQSVGAGLTWTCRYSLADQTKTDSYSVTGQDTSVTADGVGSLNYELNVLADKKIGEQVQFEIVPKNIGLVTADIKHCEVAESSASGAASVSIIGDETDAAKDKCTISTISSGLTVHTGTGKLTGFWNAFKWSTSDATDAENQQLSCTIALSESGNGNTVGAC